MMFDKCSLRKTPEAQGFCDEDFGAMPSGNRKGNQRV